ncbi:glycosyltransferase family 4 protein [Carboxylicivirga mesophila]|uniref:Glycosyltransferase family 4 protein n=1 Tax=Carboxylicivirga mesophila TaxID=1166478 RepID=A0ABS5KC91_9BACT|nr:glycosyltransferase family 1 protein [Carboxylicivirga mesophila]MBS2212123.1 glycosyltransferase family 4 protein [Carboxylicivirga mesophila]
MRIFVNGNSLKAYTSGTPQRGLIHALCRLRPRDEFHIFLSNDTEAKVLSRYWYALEQLGNVYIHHTCASQKKINLKKLVGIKSYQSDNHFDFYLSPGMPEYFNRRQQPSISTIADLSSLNAPGTSSLKWHGNRIFKNTLKWSVNSNSQIGAISDFTLSELSEKFPALQSRFFTLYNGIEDIWLDEQFKSNELTNSYKGQDYWIWWGFGSNRKNLHRLVEAYLSAHKQHNTLPRLLLVGKIADELDVLKAKINSSQQIDLIPFQDALILKTLVRNSRGLLFPSLYEGFGLPIIETYAQGRPVLYGNCTSMPEIASEFGVAVDPLDIESIKAGLMAMQTFDISQEYEQQVKKYASQFTYVNAAQQLSNRIDELISH